jgi:hypothetical protein
MIGKIGQYYLLTLYKNRLKIPKESSEAFNLIRKDNAMTPIKKDKKVDYW